MRNGRPASGFPPTLRRAVVCLESSIMERPRLSPKCADALVVLLLLIGLGVFAFVLMAMF